MKTPRHAASAKPSKKVVTTLGELIAAAYDVSAGHGPQRARRAAVLLAEASAAGRCSHQLRFIR